jgi:hypothetical protein
VRCEESTRLVRVPAAVFEELFERELALTYQTLQRVPESLANRLEHARQRQRLPPGQALLGAWCLLALTPIRP